MLRCATSVAAFIPALLLVGVMVALAFASRQTLVEDGFRFFVRSEWNPVSGARETYGALALAWGTVLTSALALTIAVPISLGIAVVLTDLAPARFSKVVGFIVELLAAVPSVVYGLWGIFVLRPLMVEWIEPALQRTLGAVPILGGVFRGPITGSDVLVASTVLALMVVPTVSSISREVLHSIPNSLREAAFALGATRWEVYRRVIFPAARRGLMGASLMGLGRALGETMAVTMLIGNQPDMAKSLFAPAATMASMIANQYPEASGKQLSALTAVGLSLFAMTLAMNWGARALVRTNQKDVL